MTMGMTMECANKRCVPQLLGTGSYDTIYQCSLELTTDIITTAKAFSEDVKQL